MQYYFSRLEYSTAGCQLPDTYAEALIWKLPHENLLYEKSNYDYEIVLSLYCAILYMSIGSFIYNIIDNIHFFKHSLSF